MHTRLRESEKGDGDDNKSNAGSLTCPGTSDPKSILTYAARLGCAILICTLISFLASPLAGKAYAGTVRQLDWCVFKYSGTIERGDSVLVEEATEGCPSVTLYLSSLGGSLREALDIAKSFFKTTTVVDEGDVCESACALIFMAGRYCGGAPSECGPSRFLHAGGKLGFHVPRLSKDLGDQSAPVSVAADLAMRAIGEIQEAFSNFSADSRGSGIRDNLIPSDLMAKMLVTPTDDYYYITDNDQFFAFDIRLFDGDFDEVWYNEGSERLQESEVYHLCFNAIFQDARGWGYGSDGFASYFASYEDAISGRHSDYLVEYHVVWVEGTGYVHTAFIDNLNMTLYQSGWCQLSPVGIADYYDVAFVSADRSVLNEGLRSDTFSILSKNIFKLFNPNLLTQMHRSMGKILQTKSVY